MNQIFEKISFLSISATWLILAVLVLRFILKKAPKWIACLLWCVVWLRLVAPVSIESAWSLAPDMSSLATDGVIWSKLDEETADLAEQNSLLGAQSDSTDFVSQKEDDAVSEDGRVNTSNSTGIAKSRPIGFSHTWLAILPYIWVAGVFLMVLYLVASYLRLRSRLKAAVFLRGNVWQSEYVDVPFIFGTVRPRIYIPYYLSEEMYEYVLSHEEAHLSRKDHWIKAIAFLILGVHWFNPLVWLSYALFCKDIEFACDECVTRNMNTDEKKKYALALLNCRGKQRIFTVCPISFGEVGVKERVVRVKTYKKPSAWIAGLLVVICVAAVSCFVTAPRKEAAQEKTPNATGLKKEDLSADEAIVNTDIHEVLSYELPQSMVEHRYSKYTGFMGGCIFEPNVYEPEGSNSAPPEWKSAGMISRYDADTMLDRDGGIITGIHGFYNHSILEPIGSLDGLCAPAFLVKGSHDLYTASEYYTLEESADENGMVTMDDGTVIPLEEVKTTSEYWYIFFARPQDKIGYVLSLNAKNYTKEDIIEFAETIQYLQ